LIRWRVLPWTISHRFPYLAGGRLDSRSDRWASRQSLGRPLPARRLRMGRTAAVHQPRLGLSRWAGRSASGHACAARPRTAEHGFGSRAERGCPASRVARPSRASGSHPDRGLWCQRSGDRTYSRLLVGVGDPVRFDAARDPPVAADRGENGLAPRPAATRSSGCQASSHAGTDRAEDNRRVQQRRNETTIGRGASPTAGKRSRSCAAYPTMVFLACLLQRSVRFRRFE